MKKIISISLALTLTGCMTVGTKIDQGKLAGFEKGKTTYSEVTSALGSPQVVTVQSDGKKSISYTYATASPDAASFIPIVGPLVGTTEGETVIVTILFGSDNKMESYSHSQSKSSFHMGGTKNEN